MIVKCPPEVDLFKEGNECNHYPPIGSIFENIKRIRRLLIEEATELKVKAVVLIPLENLVELECKSMLRLSEVHLSYVQT